MKKAEIANRMALRAGGSDGEAADRLDRVVRQILSRLRKGGQADLPGLGTFTQQPGGPVGFERAAKDRHD